MGIRGGAVLTLVRTACVAFFELKGAQGDEQVNGSPEESFARVCLLDDKNCILVRRSHSKMFAGTTLRVQFVWDICRGMYCKSQEEGNSIRCIWLHQFRRVREG